MDLTQQKADTPELSSDPTQGVKSEKTVSELSPAQIQAYTSIHVAYYNAARAELVQRIQLRDQLFVAYLTVASGYFAYMISYHTQHNGLDHIFDSMVIILPLPIICVCFSLVIVQHQIMIGSLSLYIKKDLIKPALSWGSIALDSWETSTPLVDIGDLSHLYRLFAQCSVLAIPNLYIAIYLYQRWFYIINSIKICLYSISFSVIEIATVVFIVNLHFFAHEQRKKMARLYNK